MMDRKNSLERTPVQDDYGVLPIQDALMEIYDAFAELATSHGWRWYMIGGNALGAVRHNGDFIPWDDDLDLVMPRKDYEAFRSVANQELPVHLRWVDHRNTASYPYVFGKIMDVRPEQIERLERETKSKLPQGLYVDIWPVDGFPSTFGRKTWRWLQRQSLRLVMEYREANPPMGWGQTLRHPLPFLAALVQPGLKTRQDFLEAMDRHARSLSMDKSPRTARPIHRWYEQGEVYPSWIWGEPTWLMFHGRRVPFPTDLYAYLPIGMGKDYMTLPPPDKRRPVHADSFEAPWKYGPDGERNNCTLPRSHERP